LNNIGTDRIVIEQYLKIYLKLIEENKPTKRIKERLGKLLNQYSSLKNQSS